MDKLTAEVRLADGTTWLYDTDRAVDNGEIATPGGVRQRDLLCGADGSPLRVRFRVEPNSNRVEAVFECSFGFQTTVPKPPAKPAEPPALGAYRAHISRGTTQGGSFDIPQHYARSRWRWQSHGPRPVINTVKQLVDRKLVLPYDTGIVGGIPAPARYPTYTPMGLAGMFPSQGTTGERPEIGPTTEWQAHYLAMGDKPNFDAMMAQAEAAATWPQGFGSPDGKPHAVSIEDFPKVQAFSDVPTSGSPYVPPYIPFRGTPQAIILDAAHNPADCFIPYLLTEDPYYLEALQMAAPWWLYETPAARQNDTGIVHHAQERSWAWSLRRLSECADATPDNVPSWINPKAYFEAKLENNRIWHLNTFVRSTSIPCALFRTITPIDQSGSPGPTVPPGTKCAPWEGDFAADTMGRMVCRGREAWRTNYEWTAGSAIARASGTSGWGRNNAAPYAMMLRATKTSPYFTSWKEAYDFNVTQQKWLTDPDPDRYMEPGPGQLFYTRGVLAVAKMLGVPGAAEGFAWADAQSRRWPRLAMAKWAYKG